MRRRLEPEGYRIDSFVSREAEFGWVRNLVNEMLGGYPISNRTVIFTGEHGIGKSWLLARIQDHLDTLDGIAYFGYNLAIVDDDTAAEEAVCKILEACYRFFLGENPPQEASIQQLNKRVIEALKHDQEDRCFVFLIDSVYESDTELLATLERYLLGPIAVEEKVLIIMAGRGKAYAWLTPDLKMHKNFFVLAPFSPETTYHQIECQDATVMDKADQVYQLSHGNPKLTSRLIDHSEQIDNETQLQMLLDQQINEMLDAMRTAGEHKRRLRQYLEGVAVYRSFDEMRIQASMPIYDPQKFPKLRYADARKIKERLVKPGIAHWDIDQGAYILGDSARNLVLDYLRLTNRAILITLHQNAYQLYEAWDQDNPTNPTWQQEAEYHLQMSHELRG